jgi:hypothetical protein
MSKTWIEAAQELATTHERDIEDYATQSHKRDPQQTLTFWRHLHRNIVATSALRGIIHAADLAAARTLALAASIAQSHFDASQALSAATGVAAHEAEKAFHAARDRLDSIRKGAMHNADFGSADDLLLFLVEDGYIHGSGLDAALEYLVAKNPTTARELDILKRHGVIYCSECEEMAEPVKNCKCATCSECGAASLPDDYVAGPNDWAFEATDNQRWADIQKRHKPECRWAQTRAFRLPVISV